MVALYECSDAREKADGVMEFIRRCNAILMSYLGLSLLESLIVGVINALFMLLCGMQYIGLISVIVAVTNLIPNFGPIIGGVIGAFILLLVNPIHALMFIVSCIVLQFVDGYILEPKLFTGSLGVSGLLILIAGIVLGDIFAFLEYCSPFQPRQFFKLHLSGLLSVQAGEMP